MQDLKHAPFFIIANPRSGSSLLRIICDSHPKIAVPPECGFLEWLHFTYKSWNIDDSNSKNKIEAFLSDLRSSRKFETWNFDINILFRMINISKPETYFELVELVYISYGATQGKKIMTWGDKNNYYISKLNLLNEIAPNAKFIHLVRDGRDVACSYLALKNKTLDSIYAPKLTNKIEEIAEEWHLNNLNASVFYDQIESSRVLIVKYEELLLNFTENLTRICRFLEIELHEDMRNYYVINQKRQLEPKEFLSWKKKTLSPPDISGIGKYQRILSTQQIELFNSIAKKSLELFGYE